MPYLYESHMGGLYLSEYQLDWDDLYCETCGDSDIELGYIENYDDVIALIQEDDGFIPYIKDVLENLRQELEGW